MRNKLVFLLFFTLSVSMLASGFSPVSELNAQAPDIHAEQWINSEPLNWDTLRDKVVMVEFWTFECYNCKNVEPHIKSWYEKYRQQGFEIVAVHTPEFERERDIDNVRRYVKDHGITYPVAIDNDFKIWRRFSNRYWPVMYIASSEARKWNSAATSSGLPGRPSGVILLPVRDEASAEMRERIGAQVGHRALEELREVIVERTPILGAVHGALLSPTAMRRRSVATALNVRPRTVPARRPITWAASSAERPAA